MRNFYIAALFLVFALLSPTATLADVVEDTGLLSGNIWLERGALVEGVSARIYTALWNGSETELRGTVIFRSGKVEIGRQSFRLAPESLRDISVKWQPEAGEHTLSAEVVETTLGGEATNIARAQTENLSVMVDLDTDRDGVGNLVDDDDDGDGIPDKDDPEPLVAHIKVPPGAVGKDEAKPEAPNTAIVATLAPHLPERAARSLTTFDAAVVAQAGALKERAEEERESLKVRLAKAADERESIGENATQPKATTSAVVKGPLSGPPEDQVLGKASAWLSSQAAGLGALHEPWTYLKYLAFSAFALLLASPSLVYLLAIILIWFAISRLRRRRLA